MNKVGKFLFGFSIIPAIFLPIIGLGWVTRNCPELFVGILALSVSIFCGIVWSKD